MKLEYKILWLDDKMDEIIQDDYPREIKKYLESNGFIPKIIIVKNEKDFLDQLDDSFDLILTDYHLNETSNNTRNGDKIVEEVREKSIFTEIMFYSAQGELVDTVKLDRITFFDTKKAIGNVHYEKIVEKTISLVNLTIKKFQHIVAMRGMIMHETSSLDADMLDILKSFVDKHGNNQVKQRIYNELISFHKEKLGDSEKYQKNDRIDKILKDPILISSSQRANGIDELINIIGIENFVPDFKKEIIKVRNDFAHAVYKKDENGREYFEDQKDGMDFTEERCKEIRSNIIKHKKNIDNLKQMI